MKHTKNRLFSRRGLLTLLITSAGLFSRSASAKASDPMTTMDYCYWRNENSTWCSNGIRYEKWCYICNDPGTGYTVYKCEWRPDGSC